jgi:hypothetical protein
VHLGIEKPDTKKPAAFPQAGFERIKLLKTDSSPSH